MSWSNSFIPRLVGHGHTGGVHEATAGIGEETTLFRADRIGRSERQELRRELGESVHA